MFNLAMPLAKTAQRIKNAVSRSHNMPDDMKKEAIQAEIDRNWEELMAKAETYVQGENIITNGGYFSTMSLGNWKTLCREAEVPMVPFRLASVVNPVFLFDTVMNGLRDENMDQMQAFLGGFQDIQDDEIVRFDICATGMVKSVMTVGRNSSAIPDYRGYTRRGETIFPDFNDERLMSQLTANPENTSPVWLTKWVEPVMMKGDARAGFQAAVSKENQLADGQELPKGDGDLFPCEWRVFVKNGEITAIGNYYLQVERGVEPEDELIALEMAAEARDAAQRLIDKLRELKAVPHNPNYEQREDLDPDAIHFSLDFIETRDENTPTGRRLIMLEGGPAHLRAPHWGAHPVSFGIEKEPTGVALSTKDIRPLSALRAEVK